MFVFFDIDNTILNLYNALSDYTGYDIDYITKFFKQQISDKDLDNILNLDVKFYHFANSYLRDDAYYFVSKAKNNKSVNRLIVITSRPYIFKNPTENLMRKLKISDYYFSLDKHNIINSVTRNFNDSLAFEDSQRFINKILAFTNSYLCMPLMPHNESYVAPLVFKDRFIRFESYYELIDIFR